MIIGEEEAIDTVDAMDCLLSLLTANDPTTINSLHHHARRAVDKLAGQAYERVIRQKDATQAADFHDMYIRALGGD